MARNKVEACMFCGALPCECNKPAKPKPKPKAKPKAEPAPTPAPAPAPVADTRPTFASLEGATPAPTVLSSIRAAGDAEMKRAADERREQARIEAEQRDGAELELRRAMAVLRDARILSRPDQARAERLAPRHLDEDAKQRLKEWKERRRAEREAKRMVTKRPGRQESSAARYANFKPIR